MTMGLLQGSGNVPLGHIGRSLRRETVEALAISELQALPHDFALGKVNESSR